MANTNELLIKKPDTLIPSTLYERTIYLSDEVINLNNFYKLNNEPLYISKEELDVFNGDISGIAKVYEVYKDSIGVVKRNDINANYLSSINKYISGFNFNNDNYTKNIIVNNEMISTKSSRLGLMNAMFAKTTNDNLSSLPFKLFDSDFAEYTTRAYANSKLNLDGNKIRIESPFITVIGDAENINIVLIVRKIPVLMKREEVVPNKYYIFKYPEFVMNRKDIIESVQPTGYIIEEKTTDLTKLYFYSGSVYWGNTDIGSFNTNNYLGTSNIFKSTLSKKSYLKKL